MENYVKQENTTFYWRFYTAAPDQEKRIWKARPIIVPATNLENAIAEFWRALAKLNKQKEPSESFIFEMSRFMRQADQMIKYQDHPIRDLQYRVIKRHYQTKRQWQEHWIVPKNTSLPLLDLIAQSMIS